MAVQRERRHQKHREYIMSLYQSVCHICSKPFADAIDHVVPVAQGGSDHPDNLRPAHTSCNSRKGGDDYPLWAEKNPNMWHPGFEPGQVRAERERLKKLEEAERLRHEQAAAEAEEKLREIHRLAAIRRQAKYEEELAAWRQKCETIDAIRADKPRNPVVAVEEIAPGLVSLIAAISVVWPWVFSDGELGSNILTAIVGGFIFFWIFMIPSVVVTKLLSAGLRRTLLRRYTVILREREEAWGQLVEEWESREPRSAPIPPRDSNSDQRRSSGGHHYTSRSRHFRRRW